MEFRCHDHRQDRQTGGKDFIVRVRKKGCQRAGCRWAASHYYCALLLAEEMYFQTSVWCPVFWALWATASCQTLTFHSCAPTGAFSRCRYSLEPLTVTPTLTSVVHLETLQKQARIPIPAVHQVQGAKIFKMMFKSFLLNQVVYPRSLLSNRKYWDGGAMCWRLNTFFRLTPPCVAAQHTTCVLFWEHRMLWNCSLTVPSTGLLTQLMALLYLAYSLSKTCVFSLIKHIHTQSFAALP